MTRTATYIQDQLRFKKADGKWYKVYFREGVDTKHFEENKKELRDMIERGKGAILQKPEAARYAVLDTNQND